MAKGQYIGVSGVARKVTKPYIGVSGVARNVIAGYVGVSGVARQFFAPASDTVVLQVEKVTSDTYANETTYTAENFILLNIYPTTGGTVNVTYGGLTKTITDTSGAEEPNAQQVFFGTFNGVTDSTATPSSGELTISGDCVAFASVLFHVSSKVPSYSGCITAVTEWGEVEILATHQFSGCTGLTTIDIPDGVTSISSYAFSGCTGLTTIDIPDGVTSISSYAFNGCTGLTTIDIPDGVTSIGSYAFNGCTGLTTIDIPDSVTSIDKSAFNACTGLTTIDIPDGVTSISSYAFNGCTGLTTIDIPDSVTSIRYRAFYSCSNLNDVTIPASVTTIEDGVWSDCDNLTRVTVLATTPPTYAPTDGSTKALFAGCPIITQGVGTVVVPKGCGALYKAADGWSDVEYNIVEAS